MVLIKFHNLKEIQDYYQKQLVSGNTSVLKDFKTKSGKSYDQELDDILVYEAEQLRKCVQLQIDAFYDSFPAGAGQTGGLKKAFQADTKVFNEKGQKYIGLYFDDSLSWGQSWVDGSWSGWKPILSNDGYKNKSKTQPTFEGYAGFNFIEKGIADWESTLTNKNIEVKRIGMQGKFGVAERIGYTFE